VVARPDSKGIFENELVAYVVLKDGAESASEKELIAHCRTHLEPHKVPAEIRFRRSLPKSSVGKVLRHAIA
jgi:long-chain acyl-CoA synthetase